MDIVFCACTCSSTFDQALLYSLATENYDAARLVLNSIDWNEDTIASLQSIYVDKPQFSICNVSSVCVHACLPSNQSFDKQISSHQEGGDVSRWGKWVGKATAYKFDTCAVVGVHSTMHFMDPI